MKDFALLISSIILIGVIIMVFFAIINQTIPGGSNDVCSEICLSNNLTYYKVTNTGYGGMTHTCYCKSSIGEISTRLM